MAKLKVGNPIYYVEYERNKGYSNLKCTEVKSVGSKYFTTNIAIHGKIRYNKPITAHESDNHCRYFFSKNEYDIWVRKEILLSQLRKAGANTANVCDKLEIMTIEHLEIILNIFENYE